MSIGADDAILSEALFLVQIDWNAERDVWWNDAMANQSSECEPEWLDAEDPLFILYTRYWC